MDMLIRYVLDLKSPRLLPHSGGLMAEEAHVNILITGINNKSDVDTVTNINNMLNFFLDDRQNILITRKDKDPKVKVFLLPFTLSCAYHLVSNHNTFYLHTIAISERHMHELLKTWKIKDTNFILELIKDNTFRTRQIPRNTIYNGFTELSVKLDTVDKIRAFVEQIVKYPCRCDLISGNYIVDAKSIMGIFSLDLTKDIILKIYEEDADIERIKDWIVAFPKKDQ